MGEPAYFVPMENGLKPFSVWFIDTIVRLRHKAPNIDSLSVILNRAAARARA